ncbi:MAG TPA: hypothetical protein VFR03_18815 [Thermoanaerobaculia bacterium]|nr:hypothetical protein [Thermoanaerobaculia bacterium]
MQMDDYPTGGGIQSTIQKFVNQMTRVTVRLVRVTSRGAFEGIASGFIVKSHEGYFLISAGHAFWSGAQWLLETNYNTSSETLLIPLGSAQLISATEFSDLERLLSEEASAGELNALGLPALVEDCYESKVGEAMDIAWVKINLDALRVELAKAGELVNAILDLDVYTGPLDAEPSTVELYGFASFSHVQVEEHPHVRLLDRGVAYEIGMEYDGLDARYDLYRFKLSRAHQGHNYYHGSSGSPIADSSGLIVAIVVCGSTSENIIFGFPLKRIARLLHLG